VVACAKDGALGTLEGCAAHDEWLRLDPIAKAEADAALVAMLDDPNPLLVELAALSLKRGEHPYRKDKVLAEKLVARLGGAIPAAALESVVRVVARIDADATGLGTRLGESSAKLPTAARAIFVSTARQASPAHFYASTVELAKTAAEPELRRAALEGLFSGIAPGKSAETCEVFATIAEDAKAPEALAAQAADLATKLRQEPCRPQYDRVLKALEARSKVAKVEATEWASALGQLAKDNPAATAAQSKKASALLQALVENAQNPGALRVFALEGLVEVAPATAKPLLARLAKDKDAAVAKRAAELGAKPTK
jgi:hypothetical protein